MKTTKLILFVPAMTAILHLSSCGNDDEKPQTIPSVTTKLEITTTTTTAQVSGEIIDDGNASITEAGFVYSSNVDMPTTSESKKTVTDLEEFSAEITGLTSGTIYNVRAYAINKKGTAYGEKRTFETGNQAPVAMNVTISGILEVNQDLTASFDFTDAENDNEGTATYQWYVANDAAGTGETLINGATSETFHTLDEHNGKHLKVVVTPVAQTGTLTGTPVASGYTIAIGAETVTFTYNGEIVTYGTILRPSGKKWLDRNLGATRVAQSAADYLAYGDMYQWGRLADGHHKITRTGTTDATATGVTGTFGTRSSEDIPPHDQFIVYTGVRGDWRNPQAGIVAGGSTLWQGVGGKNNPCPPGWRIPTLAEWDAEGFTNIADGYAKLKLTYSGLRQVTDAAFNSTEVGGYYWTSTVDESAAIFYSMWVGLEADRYYSGARNRGHAVPCRCIKE